MILILAYWFFLFLLLLSAGVLVKKTFKLQTKNISILLLMGMFFYTVLFTIIAFFLPLNGKVLIIAVLTAVFSGFYFSKENNDIVSEFNNSFKNTSAYIKAVFLILIIGALVKSSASPTLIDNESYYVQTIKWLNEFGFVKGLGNLHLFLAQTSPWHVLQAGFNFSFVTDKINDINGFLFIICTWYYISIGQNYWVKHNRLHWISFIPLLSFVFFMFIDSPSPDLPLLMMLPVVLCLFTATGEENENYSILFLLTVFLCFIKVTIAPFALLLLFGYKFSKYKWITLTGILIGGLWMAKNIILSGYPLYPFTVLPTGFDWTIPEFSISNTHNISNKSIYGIKSPEPAGKKFISWIMIKNISGWLNKLIIIAFIALPFFRTIRNNKQYRIIYLVSLLNFIILFFTSPQFRFFLPYLVFFSAFIGSELIKSLKQKQKKRLYNAGIATGCAIAFGFVFININSDSFINRHSRFSGPAIILPRPNSSLNAKYEKETAGNLSFNTPTAIPFRYATGDGLLPCVNINYIKWMSHHTGHIPQMRGSNLKDGFYSLNVSGPKNKPQ